MKKYGFCFVLSVASALASESDPFTVKVPFAFQVGAIKLPAGDYRFQEEGEGGLMRISGAGKGHSAVVLTYAGAPSLPSSKSALTFAPGKGAYVLSEIHPAGRATRVLLGRTPSAGTDNVAAGQ